MCDALVTSITINDMEYVYKNKMIMNKNIII